MIENKLFEEQRQTLQFHSMHLKGREDLHLPRKIWHICGVSLMALIYAYFGKQTSLHILLPLISIILPLDLLRQRSRRLNAIVLKTFGWCMRKNEFDALSGTTYLFAGGLILLFFSPHIVILSLLFLAFADPLASYFGIRFGRDRIVRQKTLQGTGAAFIVCCIISAIYYYQNNIMIERLFIVSPLSGVIGALSELVPIGKLDDNFTFPVLCALFLSVLFYLFGGFGI